MTSIEKWGVAEGHAPFFDVVMARVGRDWRTGEQKSETGRQSCPVAPKNNRQSPGVWQRFS